MQSIQLASPSFHHPPPSNLGEEYYDDEAIRVGAINNQSNNQNGEFQDTTFNLGESDGYPSDAPKKQEEIIKVNKRAINSKPLDNDVKQEIRKARMRQGYTD